MKKWRLLWSASAKKDLKKFDKYIAKVIVAKATAELNNIDNPRAVLIPLRYAKKGQYKYRVGSYRVICTLVDELLIVEAVTVGHRREVYK